MEGACAQGPLAGYRIFSCLSVCLVLSVHTTRHRAVATRPLVPGAGLFGFCSYEPWTTLHVGLGAPLRVYQCGAARRRHCGLGGRRSWRRSLRLRPREGWAALEDTSTTGVGWASASWPPAAPGAKSCVPPCCADGCEPGRPTSDPCFRVDLPIRASALSCQAGFLTNLCGFAVIEGMYPEFGHIRLAIFIANTSPSLQHFDVFKTLFFLYTEVFQFLCGEMYPSEKQSFLCGFWVCFLLGKAPLTPEFQINAPIFPQDSYGFTVTCESRGAPGRQAIQALRPPSSGGSWGPGWPPPQKRPTRVIGQAGHQCPACQRPRFHPSKARLQPPCQGPCGTGLCS